MATFGQIQTAVSKRLLDPTYTAVSQSDVAASINDSIRYWKYKRFWFNEGYLTQTAIKEDAVIPLPTDFLVPSTENDGFNIEYSAMRYPLKKITQLQYDNIWLSNGFGLPRMYARVGTDYVLYPKPDRDYTINCHYLKEYQPLVDPDDTNDFTENAERLLILWTTANLIEEIRQDLDMGGNFRTKAMDEYDELQTMTRKSNASGSVVISSTLMS